MTGPGPRMRASDADRQAMVDLLAQHFTAGRLSAAEYDERVRAAYASTYLDELPPLSADLPDETAGRGFGRAGAGSGFAGSGFDDGPADRLGWAGDDGDPAADRRTAGWAAPGPWWGARGGGGGPTRIRHRPPIVVPAILVFLLLVVLTHGFVLFPLLWIGLAVFLIGRHRHGGCGRRVWPHPPR